MRELIDLTEEAIEWVTKLDIKNYSDLFYFYLFTKLPNPALQRVICPYDICWDNLITSFKLKNTTLYIQYNITVEPVEITFNDLSSTLYDK